MSVTQKLGVIGTLALFSALLFLGINSRHSISGAQSSQNALSQNTFDNQRVIPAEVTQDINVEGIMATLEKKFPGIKISDVEPSPLNGFYQVFYSGQLLYVSKDGQFLFTGNLLELAKAGGPINHTQLAMAYFERKKDPMRASEIAAIDESDMVIFRAAKEKHVVTVFTDVDCGYCRKLHKEMALYNEQGITVRYLAYPRAGIGSEAYNKLVSVWCADDRLTAMNDAKLRRQFTTKSCKNPVNSHYNLTRRLSLSGTPMIILNDGELIGGYIPASGLAQHLSEKAEKQAKKVTLVNVSI